MFFPEHPTQEQLERWSREGAVTKMYAVLPASLTLDPVYVIKSQGDRCSGYKYHKWSDPPYVLQKFQKSGLHYTHYDAEEVLFHHYYTCICNSLSDIKDKYEKIAKYAAGNDRFSKQFKRSLGQEFSNYKGFFESVIERGDRAYV